MIAEIAEQYLEPSVREKVRGLLAAENASTLAAVSTWADQIRQQRRASAPWHYVDIQITDPTYVASRDCPRGSCLVAKLIEFTSVLGDRNAEIAVRLEALKFIVHFIGDLHQPFHVADNHDRGGNEVTVVYNGRKSNLHAVWDTALLAPVVQGAERSYALALIKSISPSDVSAWGLGSIDDWANDTHGVAIETVYGKLSHVSGNLPPNYGDEARPIANNQLKKGGVRLAHWLNVALR